MGARPSAFAKPPVEVKAERVWSEPQQQIFRWFNHTLEWRGNPAAPYTGNFDNLVVRARAGTGKTTTIIEGVNRAPEDSILLCAFNKRIADELNARLDNPRAEAKTLHALGLQMIRREWRGMPVEPKRFGRQESLTDRALKSYERESGQKTPFQIRRMVTTLHTKTREMQPLDPTVEDLTRLAFMFDLIPDEGWGAYDLDFVVMHALAAVVDAGTTPPDYSVGIDYADMIFLPLAWNLTAKDYQLVVIDEMQDMTMGQLEIAERVCSGRICGVGDDFQSIYQFRGADAGAIDRMKAKLGALELPLKTTYRCGVNIVKHAQRLVPDIEAGADNPPGIVDHCDPDQLLSLVQPGDFVLSRLNAPLVAITLRLLRRGVRATMSGRDIGAGVLAVLKKLKVTEWTSISDVIKLVEQWERKQVTKLAVMGLADQQDKVRDQAGVLYAFAEDAGSAKEMFQKLENLFSDVEGNIRGQVLLSSIHKAKGTENPRVFLLMDSLYRRGHSQEEANLEYVGCTRAISHLTLVRA